MANYSIKNSEKDKAIIEFIEDYLDIEFKGDFNNPKQVRSFINAYIDDAETMYNELKCEYEAYIGY